MPPTPVELTTYFRRAYKKKPRAMQEVIRAAVTLRTDWRHPGLRTHRVLGSPGVFEARLDRGNRLTFHWDDDTIVLRNHCNQEILRRNP